MERDLACFPSEKSFRDEFRQRSTSASNVCITATWRYGRIMRLIHRVADKPIQFPRGHCGPQVRLIAAAHLKGCLVEATGPPTKRSHKRDVAWLREKGIFLRARATILQIPSLRLIAVHRSGASRQLITRTSSQLNATNRWHCWAPKRQRFPPPPSPPSNGLGTNGKSDYAYQWEAR